MYTVCNQSEKTFSFQGASGRRYILQPHITVQDVPEEDIQCTAFQAIASHCLINSQQFVDNPQDDFMDADIGDPLDLEEEIYMDAEKRPQCEEITQAGTQCSFDATYFDEAEEEFYCTRHAKQHGDLDAMIALE